MVLAFSSGVRGALSDSGLVAGVITAVITAAYQLWRRVIVPAWRARRARFANLVAEAVGDRFDRSEATIDDLHHRLSQHLVEETAEQASTRDRIEDILTTMQDTLAARSAAFDAGVAPYLEQFSEYRDKVDGLTAGQGVMLERLDELVDTAATVKADLDDTARAG